MSAPISPLIKAAAAGGAVARTRTPRLVALVFLVLAVTNFVLTVLVRGAVPGPLQLLAVAVGIAIFVMLWRCRVELTRDRATIVNPIRTHQVPRSTIADIAPRPSLLRPHGVIGQHPGNLDFILHDGTRIWVVGCSVLPRRNLPESTAQRQLTRALQHWLQTGQIAGDA